MFCFIVTGTLVVLFNMSLMDNGEPELNVSKMIEAFLVRITTKDGAIMKTAAMLDSVDRK